MRCVAIAGVGLIGASFALALRRAGFAGELVGISSSRSLEAGIKVGAISRGVSLAEAAESADLIYLSQPIEQILETLAQLGPLVREDCLVTDAGSTKRVIVEAATRHFKSGLFLGGHPMAGKESRGAEQADACLFVGRPYVLTPAIPEGRATEKVDSFHGWLEKMGAQIYLMSAAEHDRTVALTSHLPQLISTALAVTLHQQKQSAVHEIFGPGLIDMTRLALSAPQVWRSVLQTNSEAVLKALAEYKTTLENLQFMLAEDRLEEMFGNGADFARSIRVTTLEPSTVTDV